MSVAQQRFHWPHPHQCKFPFGEIVSKQLISESVHCKKSHSTYVAPQWSEICRKHDKTDIWWDIHVRPYDSSNLWYETDGEKYVSSPQNSMINVIGWNTLALSYHCLHQSKVPFIDAESVSIDKTSSCRPFHLGNGKTSVSLTLKAEICCILTLRFKSSRQKLVLWKSSSDASVLTRPMCILTSNPTTSTMHWSHLQQKLSPYLCWFVSK